MTEQEWLASNHPYPMLNLLRATASGRKASLFGAACCRRLWHLLTDGRSRQAVEVAEQFAEEAVDADSLRAVAERAWDAETAACANLLAALSGETGGTPVLGASEAARSAAWLADGEWWQACSGASFAVAAAVSKEDRDRIQQQESMQQAVLLRDIIGNPFRPVTALPSWRTTTVTDLAQAIYTERAFDRMPILADALEDAGCANEAVLAHCRGLGPHARGCWVVDLLLGKE